MPSFSTRSKSNLDQAQTDLQRLFNAVIKHYDCTVICGHRSQEIRTKPLRKERARLDTRIASTIASRLAPWM